jgi:ribosome-associated protein
MSETGDEPIPRKGGIEVAPGVRVAAGALRLQFARSGGPGGQNVNKVNSKVQLWVAIGDLTGLHPGATARLRALAVSRLTDADEIHITSEEHRTQTGNRRAVMERLRELIVEAQKRPTIRRKTRPGRAAKERRLEGKRQRSEIKSFRRGEAAE